MNVINVYLNNTWTNNLGGKILLMYSLFKRETFYSLYSLYLTLLSLAHNHTKVISFFLIYYRYKLCTMWRILLGVYCRICKFTIFTTQYLYIISISLTIIIISLNTLIYVFQAYSKTLIALTTFKTRFYLAST